MDNKQLGYVLWFDEREGRGVIRDFKRREYYTDVSVIPGRKPLVAYQDVSFVSKTVGTTRCAQNVESIDTSDWTRCIHCDSPIDPNNLSIRVCGRCDVCCDDEHAAKCCD